MAKRGKAPRFSGVFNVIKPAGITSHDVVAAIRRAARERRVGHAGTLDPLATGVLVVCVGKATRVAEYLQNTTKRYQAVIMLGVETDTYDAEGENIDVQPIAGITRVDIERVIAADLLGDIEQTPPMYSALKRKGVPLYQLARQGVNVERAARPVHIMRFDVMDWQPPHLVADITCSKGTYIRSLAHDLGQLLGCGGHLTQLARTASGSFHIDDAVPLDTLLPALERDEHAMWLIPTDKALPTMPSQPFGSEAVQRLTHGQQITDTPPHPLPEQDQLYRAYGPTGEFVAIVRYDTAQAHWQPTKVFATQA